jgi:hypothetical protein
VILNTTVEAAPELRQVSREELRAFHITGRGLEHLTSTAPLRLAMSPAVLEQLPDLERLQSADLLALYAAAVESSRSKARTQFLEKIKLAHERLRELLALDHELSPDAYSARTVSASLGSPGSLFRAKALADAFQARTGGLRPMDTERRARIEATIVALDAALHEAQWQPPFWVFHTGQASVPSGVACELHQAPDSFAAALEFCDEQLSRFAMVLRALRTARLESESGFVPSIHEELLQRFDWQAAEPDELLALPPVVVLETAERLAQRSLTSFGRLLRSGRPLQVLVTCSGLYADDLSGFVPDFGYLAIAHREAFVLQSSLARPDHVTAGLSEMTRSLRPAVAVVSVPRDSKPEAWLETGLLYLSRAFPLFRYDPDRGETWSERFALFTGTLPELTLAHAAAVSSGLRHHFRVIADPAPDSEQMELVEYLQKYRQAPPLAIPFIWIKDGEGALQRAIMTRELAHATRDRHRAWRIFEELAGVNNAYAEIAVAHARQEVRDSAQEGAKQEGAMQAIHRVVAILTEGQLARPAEPKL